MDTEGKKTSAIARLLFVIFFSSLRAFKKKEKKSFRIRNSGQRSNNSLFISQLCFARVFSSASAERAAARKIDLLN
jgi:hypothetical protein